MSTPGKTPLTPLNLHLTVFQHLRYTPRWKHPSHSGLIPVCFIRRFLQEALLELSKQSPCLSPLATFVLPPPPVSVSLHTCCNSRGAGTAVTPGPMAGGHAEPDQRDPSHVPGRPRREQGGNGMAGCGGAAAAPGGRQRGRHWVFHMPCASPLRGVLLGANFGFGSDPRTPCFSCSFQSSRKHPPAQ